MSEAVVPPPGFIAIPCGERMYSRAASAILRAVSAAPAGTQIHFDSTAEWGGVGIAEKREAITRAFLRAEGTPRWLLMLDSDMLPDEDLVPRLLSHGPHAGVVGAFYFTRRRPFQPACGVWCGEDLRFPEPASWGGLVSCSWIGSGAMLVWRWVFEKLDAPWFAPKPGYRGAGEDVQFCQAALDAGIRVHVDMGAVVRHIGTVAIDEDFVTNYRAGPRFAADLEREGLSVDAAGLKGRMKSWPRVG